MSNSSASAPSGMTTGMHRQAVFAREVQVALVVRRAAEDRAGAVIHQHEIRDIDRQLPVRDRTDATAVMPVS